MVGVSRRAKILHLDHWRETEVMRSINFTGINPGAIDSMQS